MAQGPRPRPSLYEDRLPESSGGYVFTLPQMALYGQLKLCNIRFMPGPSLAGGPHEQCG
jgi:hypothetical protein